MSTATNYGVLTFFVKYPVFGVLGFLGAGIWMTSSALQSGKEMGRYVNGARVGGVVAELRGADFEMTARWSAPGGGAHTGTVELYATEVETLRVGSRVDLILASDNPAHAITTARLKGHAPVTVAGVTMDPLGFAGLGLMLVGLLFPVMMPRLQKELAQHR